jgi:hypothetical protein
MLSQKRPDRKVNTGQLPMAHTYNPNYSGGRDQEDRNSKPAQVNSSRDPSLEKALHRKWLVKWHKL